MADTYLEDIEANFTKLPRSLCEHKTFISHSHPVLEVLDNLGVTYCGGYALALYATTEYPEIYSNEISSYYSDIDIITPDSATVLVFKARLPYNYVIVKEYVTPRATSLWILESNITCDNWTNEQYMENSMMLQFVTSWTEQPVVIINRFDFINCQIAFNNNEGFIYHEDLDELLETRTLQVNTDIDTHAPPNNTLMSLGRAEKYCKRWNWKLDWPSFNNLVNGITERQQNGLIQETDSAKQLVTYGTKTSTQEVLKSIYNIHGLKWHDGEANENYPPF
jgi:hypothetical protein